MKQYDPTALNIIFPKYACNNENEAYSLIGSAVNVLTIEVPTAYIIIFLIHLELCLAKSTR